jgi:hypothetical protein
MRGRRERSARPGRSAVVLSWLCLLPLDAGAAPPNKPSSRPAVASTDAAKQAARAFSEGRALYEQRKFVGAIAAFQRAHRLRPHYRVQCGIARCYENLNQMVKAAAHYRRCLDEGAKDAAMAVRVRTSLASVEAQITWVAVRSPGRGGVVHVDGVALGPAPRRIALDPGAHVIEVRRPGARPARKRLRTLGGEQHSVELVPVEIDRSAPAATAATAAPSDRSAPRRALPPAWFWTGVGLTVALATVATVFGVQTLQRRSDYEDKPTEQGYESFTDRRLLSNVFWAASAAAGIGTTVLFFYTDFGDREQAAAPSTARTFGLGIRGTF